MGSLLYLYVVFSWYSGGAALTGTWLSMAAFLAPLVAAFAVVASITLFFVGIGMAAGKTMDDKGMWLWKFITAAGMSLLIVSRADGAALLGFLLTYIGAMVAMM